MKKITLIILILTKFSFAQNPYYDRAFNDLKEMIESDKVDFKKAVFITENAFWDNKLNYNDFNNKIKLYSDIALDWMKSNPLENYHYDDSINFAKNRSIFHVITDTIFYLENIPLTTGFSYDFQDFFGEVDWTKQFVSKLIKTKSGNCHSMPYLYKIIAEDIEANASLALAPNHIYIKNRSKNPEITFYNTELTSKCFPTDSWLMASSGITNETIISGIWCESLNDKQNISLCLIDLAEGYQHKDFDYDPDFVLKCCDLALVYYPNFINALLLKGETLRQQYMKKKSPSTLGIMNKIYSQIYDLGYKNVSINQYLQWLEELANNVEKYQNKNLNFK